MKFIDKIKQHVNNKTVIAAAVLACAAIALAAAVRIRTFNAFYVELDLRNMSGDMLIDEDGSRYITSPGTGCALEGPGMAIDKGYYTIDVDYYAENDFPLLAYSGKSSDYVVSDYNLFKRQSTHKSFNMRIKDKIEDFEIRAMYGGEGELRINRITISKSDAAIRVHAAIALLAVICAALCYLFREKLEKNKHTIAAIFLIAFLSSVPSMAVGMVTGHDGNFHLLRIEGLAQGLRDGMFPVRMQSNWMEGYGYPVSIYYGDILLYIPALLRIMGFSIEHAYKIYLFLINIGTAAAAYICFARIAKNSRIALLGAAGYVLAAYRLTNIYVRAALGEYSAMMFFPVVFLAVYGIYADDADNFRKYMKNAVLLAFGMTGIIQTHLISTAIVSLILAFVCILMIKKTVRPHTMIAYAAAAIMAIALNLFFFVPFWDYSKNVAVKALDSGAGNAYVFMQKMGAYIGQYFMLYQKAYGHPVKNMGERMAITPGIVLMTAFFAGIYFSIKYKDRMIRLMTFMSAMLLWMSLNIFPWDFIIRYAPFAAWMKHIQFPWRFLSAAQMFLSLLLCLVLVKIRKEKRVSEEAVMIALFVLLVLSSSQMFGAIIQGNNYDDRYDNAAINSFDLGGKEYVRLGTDINDFDGKMYAGNAEITRGGYTRQGKYAVAECSAADSAEDAWVEFPIMNYKNYAAYGEDGQPFPIADGNNNVVRVMLPGGYSGTVKVAYEIPGFYRAADICSLAALAAVVGIVFWLNRKPCEKRIKIIKRTR